MKHSGSTISLTTSIHTTTGTPLSSPVKRKRRLSSLATGSFHSIGTRSPTPISSSAASSPLASPFASPNTITKSTGSRSNNARRVLSLNSTVTISSPPFSTTATTTNNNTKTNTKTKTNENRLLTFIMTHIRRLLVAALIVTVIEVVQKVTLHHQLVVELSNNANANDSIHAWQPQTTIQEQTQTQTNMQRNLSQEQQQQRQRQQQNNTTTTTETLLRQAPPLDVTFLSKRQQSQQPQQDSSACSVAPGHGPEGRMGFQALLKVNIANSTTTKSHQHQPRLLCIVITDSTQHDTILQAIVDTYAPHCDGFMAASNQTDVTLGAVDLFSGIDDTTTNDDNNNNDNNDWTRTKLIWQYVQEHFLHNKTTTTTTTMNFDAFSLGQSDTYTIPQNLQLLLSEYTDNTNTNTNNRWRNEPMYVGGAVVPNRQSPEERFCGSGAGYILNALAVQAVVSATTSNTDDDCAQNPNGFAADRQLATCLYQQSQQQHKQQQQQQQQQHVIDNNPIQCAKTTDPDSGGGSALRFLEFGIDYQANWNKAVRGPIKAGPLADYHGIFLRASTGGISNKAIGFHLVHGTEALVFDGNDGNGNGNDDGNDQASSYNEIVSRTIRRVHAILYHQCTDTWEQPTMAKDEDGTIGYVADPTYLKKHPLTFSKRPGGKGKSICSTPFGEGPEGYYGYQGLQKIEIDKGKDTDNNNNNNNNKKVLCLIYTHSNRHDRIRAIAETYGAKCDGFLAASNQTDPTIGAVNLLHEGPEAYGNMWLKVRAIWQYVYDNYRNDFDYFHLGGDDHYVIPENLKKMAASRDDNNQILFMGGSMIDFPHTNIRYCGGGSGYTLNTKALTTFVMDVMPTCRPHFETSQEDRMISNCFRSYLGISCMDTNDELGEARYHQEHVDFHASWTKEIPNVWKADDLETHHGIVSKEGLGQISKTSVSFHLKNAWKSSNAMKKMKDNGVVDDSGIRRYHAILHGLCD